jgi:hypothetical protein
MFLNKRFVLNLALPRQIDLIDEFAYYLLINKYHITSCNIIIYEAIAINGMIVAYINLERHFALILLRIDMFV